MPGAPFASKWEAYKTARDAGKTPAEIVAERIVSEPSARKWEKKYSPSGVVEVRPDGIRAEPADLAGGKRRRKSKRARAPRTHAAPITEESAGLILKGISEVIAFLLQEQELALTDDEVELLEHPLTESLSLLPASAAKNINKYAAPGVFASQFIVIYGRKVQRIALRRAGLLRDESKAEHPPTGALAVAAATNLEAMKAAARAVAEAQKPNGAATVSTGEAEPEAKSDLEGV